MGKRGAFSQAVQDLARAQQAARDAAALRAIPAARHPAPDAAQGYAARQLEALRDGQTQPSAKGTAGKRSDTNDGYRSKAEASFADELKRRHPGALIEYEPLKVCTVPDPIDSRKVWYCLDFGVRPADGSPAFYYTVKGGYFYRGDKLREVLVRDYCRKWGIALYYAHRGNAKEPWKIERLT